MTTLRHEIRIDAPVAKVWQALAALDGVQKFNPLVASSRYISEQHEGVGATRHCELEPKGWVEERVWDWSPQSALGLEIAASEYPVEFMRWRTQLSPEGAATLVTQDMSYKVKFGVFGALLDRLVMRRMLDRSVVKIFAGLKQYVEESLP